MKFCSHPVHASFPSCEISKLAPVLLDNDEPLVWSLPSPQMTGCSECAFEVFQYIKQKCSASHTSVIASPSATFIHYPPKTCRSYRLPPKCTSALLCGGLHCVVGGGGGGAGCLLLHALACRMTNSPLFIHRHIWSANHHYPRDCLEKKRTDLESPDI